MPSINQHRLKNNPLEQAFLDAWRKANEGDRLLKYILDRDHDNRGRRTPTDEEREAVATVIQWLGSPVGQGFLKDVQRG